MEIKQTDKKFYQSKKFLAFLLVWLAAVGLISLAMATHQNPEVIRELIGSLGLALTTCSTATVAGQSWQDATRAKK